MEAAWRLTFQGGVDSLAPLLVIVWHSEWMRPDRELWIELHNKLTTIAEAKEPVRILVIIFGDTPDDLGEEEEGNPLIVLLRALAADTLPDAELRSRHVGWASVSEASGFEKAAANWSPPKDPNESALLRLCAVCAEITDWPGGSKSKVELPSLTLTQFFQFLSDPVRFRASILHGAKNPQQERRRLSVLKWLAAHAQIPHSLPLKILVVDNDAKEPKESSQKVVARFVSLQRVSKCPLRFLREAEFYVVSTGFEDLKSEDRREKIPSTKYVAGRWEREDGIPSTIPWAELDLVLQDVMLGNSSGHVTGLELASFYFDACPQALVFLLTGLDIESLVVSGDVNWKFVDAVIPKDGLEGLWFEYGRCFRERFGSMFWLDWATARDPLDRNLLRHLYCSLRKWQIEPDILWHGQNLPEMIDHANRHITALWRLTNEFVGTLIENGGADDSILDRKHRVALALAVWMHDVGHRGDEYLTESMHIRASHAGISERLLLRNPDAYSLDWLLKEVRTFHEPCGRSDTTGRNERLKCRNREKCLGTNENLCLLREVGLLCGHHQSNTPLAARGKNECF
jgi:hypothetical protein